MKPAPETVRAVALFASLVIAMALGGVLGSACSPAERQEAGRIVYGARDVLCSAPLPSASASSAPSVNSAR